MESRRESGEIVAYGSMYCHKMLLHDDLPYELYVNTFQAINRVGLEGLEAGARGQTLFFIPTF